MVRSKHLNILLAAAVTASAGGMALARTKKRLDWHTINATKYLIYWDSISSDTQFADRLATSGLVPLLQRQAAAAGTPARKALFKSELLELQLSAPTAPPHAAQLQQQYLQDIETYLASHPAGLDGYWALHQAFFIDSHIMPPLVNRVELISDTPAARKPMAKPAALMYRLLKIAHLALYGLEHSTENLPNFNNADEAAFVQAANGQTQAGYMLALAAYYRGLSAPDGPDRTKMLRQAILLIRPWAKAKKSTVLYPALLLEGKARAAAGQFGRALHNLRNADATGAPVFVQYQARYQIVLTYARHRRFDQANKKLDAFQQWLGKQAVTNTPQARVAVEMLGYHVQMDEAKAAKTPAAKTAARAKAVGILQAILRANPAYAPLIYQEIGSSGAGAGPKHFAKMSALQALAVAWKQAQANTRQGDEIAVRAALSVLKHHNISQSSRLEATLIAGLCAGRIGRINTAAALNVQFVSLAPKDPRSKGVLQLAISQLERLSENPNASPKVRQLLEKALQLGYTTLGEKRLAFAYASQLEHQHHLKRAAALFNQVPQSSPLYLDAQYRVLRIATDRLTKLQHTRTPHQQVLDAATQLVTQSNHFLALLAHPPASAAASSVARARLYLPYIDLIQASTYLSPLRNPQEAGKYLDQLQAMANKLPSSLKGAILQYRIRQFQLEGKNSKILSVVNQIAGNSGQDKQAVIKHLIGKWDAESRRLRKVHPKHAQRLAGEAAKLIRQLMLQAQRHHDAHDAYGYEQILADTLIRAGQALKAQKIFQHLQKVKPQDIRNFLGEARARFYTNTPNHYQHDHDLWVRIIVHLPAGSPAFWDGYYYVIRCNEAMHKNAKSTRAALRSLRAIYGSAIGGKARHKAFKRFMRLYNVH